jgi:hypothetical protein
MFITFFASIAFAQKRVAMLTTGNTVGRFGDVIGIG